MHLLDLSVLDTKYQEAALVYLVRNGLRVSDMVALEAKKRGPERSLIEKATLSHYAHLIVDGRSRPAGLLALRPWGVVDGVDEGLLWGVCRSDLEEPFAELLDVVGPYLQELAQAVPRLWTFKAPGDAPEALPRLSAETLPRDDLVLVGPEPSFDSPAWIDHLMLATGWAKWARPKKGGYSNV